MEHDSDSDKEMKRNSDSDKKMEHDSNSDKEMEHNPNSDAIFKTKEPHLIVLEDTTAIMKEYNLYDSKKNSVLSPQAKPRLTRTLKNYLIKREKNSDLAQKLRQLNQTKDEAPYKKSSEEATNNEAEYEALIHGLRVASSLGIKRLIVYDDSAVVINKVNKDWDCTKDNMDAYCAEVRKLEKIFQGLKIHHVLRDSNVAANVLANVGSDRAKIPPGIFVEELIAPSIK
ncbi:uncharacterized protein [Miscanthus floridulus]|uniref:uncharacterized protein n=1 Tax=Miscanthus floridulus TaxID=154761 RepID=UPI0034595D45